jgi:hypothetical protein
MIVFFILLSTQLRSSRTPNAQKGDRPAVVRDLSGLLG